MDLASATRECIRRIREGAQRIGVSLESAVDERSVDVISGRFVLLGKQARVCPPSSGFSANINPDWFGDNVSPPLIYGQPFEYYVIGIFNPQSRSVDYYHICHFEKMRQFVLDADPALPPDYRTRKRWRGQIHLTNAGDGLGYLRWTGESYGYSQSARTVRLNNLREFVEEQPLDAQEPGPVGSEESEAHRQLVEYVAANPCCIGVTEPTRAMTEFSFITGDRADIVLFGSSETTIVEVELQGATNFVTAIHRLQKYRALAAIAEGVPYGDPHIKTVLAALDVECGEVQKLAKRYDVECFAIHTHNGASRSAKPGGKAHGIGLYYRAKAYIESRGFL